MAVKAAQHHGIALLPVVKLERPGADRALGSAWRRLGIEDDRGVLPQAEQKIAVWVVQRKDHRVRVWCTDRGNIVKQCFFGLVGRALGFRALD